jgi:hypothetical protein
LKQGGWGFAVCNGHREIQAASTDYRGVHSEGKQVLLRTQVNGYDFFFNNQAGELPIILKSKERQRSDWAQQQTTKTTPAGYIGSSTRPHNSTQQQQHGCKLNTTPYQTTTNQDKADKSPSASVVNLDDVQRQPAATMQD